MQVNVSEFIYHTAEKYANKTALVSETGEITFGDLNDFSEKIAFAIMQKLAGRVNRPIAVFCDKDIGMLASFVAITKSGNFYTPLDVKAPSDRTKQVIACLNPSVVLTDKKNQAAAARLGIAQERMLVIEDCEMIKPDTVLLAATRKNVLDTDPVYVLFTSGSTGSPKGVVIAHRSVIDYTEWVTATFHIGADTVFGNQAPFYFDNSILDIYCTLKNGAELHIIPEYLFAFPIDLLEYLSGNAINTIFWVPSALVNVANCGVLGKVELPLLKKILFCGEVMPTKQYNIWKRYVPDAIYANLYGPTEITDVCCYYIIDRPFEDHEPLPIGRACENTEVIVVNEENRLCGAGESGELCVRGTCLSSGYYKDVEKTNKAFVQNPTHNDYRDLVYRTGDIVKYGRDGEICFVGRKDNQVKRQGHRIELGDIESAAASLEGIEACCAVFDDYNHRIGLFFISATAGEEELRKGLADLLPHYMLPDRMIRLDTMPVNVNKKTDRLTLRKKFMEINGSGNNG